jgi:putative tricarboxylic transport membrane protein
MTQPTAAGVPAAAGRDAPAPPPVGADATTAEPALPGAGPVAGLVAGAVLVVAGVALFTRALLTGLDRGITLGGPTTAPIVVTGLWVVVAAAYLVTRIHAARRAAPGAATSSGPGGVRWRTPLLLLVALLAYAIVLKYTVVGYVLATTAFYLASARLLGTRPWRETVVRDAAVAVGLSLAIYLTFTKLLGIVLPAGVLPL